jgi:hypothetical protein
MTGLFLIYEPRDFSRLFLGAEVSEPQTKKIIYPYLNENPTRRTTCPWI